MEKVRKKKTMNSAVFRENFWLTMMVLPGALLLLIFNYVPMVGVVMAFKKYNPILGIWGSPWCGLDNFEFFFTSQDAVRVIRNTLGYSVTFLVLDLIAGVGLRCV